MRITVITRNESNYGLRLLNQLHWDSVTVEQVIVLTDTRDLRRRWWRRAIRQIGLGQALVYAALRYQYPFVRRRPLWRGRRLQRDYRALASRVDYAPSARSPETVAALRRGQPDLCLLAQSGIVPPAVLAVPSLATLNAHPGLLPHHRGLDTELWAIYEQRFDLVGATLHVVDPGIDTGPILERRPYRWAGDETLDRLFQRLTDFTVDLLVEACHQDWPAYLERARPQAGGKLYHLMPPRLWLPVGHRLRRFVANQPRRATFVGRQEGPP